MRLPDPVRRALGAALAATCLAAVAPAAAQDTKVAFQLDWRFEGPSALFLLPKAKGYFAAEKLDVTIDAGAASWTIAQKTHGGTPRWYVSGARAPAGRCDGRRAPSGRPRRR